MSRPRLVIFGSSNILSDLFDCAMANGLDIGRVVLHHAEQMGERDRPLAERLAALAPFGQTPLLDHVDTFVPGADELYLLGPTTPTRAELAGLVAARWALPFTTLVHPSAYVSPLATLAPGVFVGANSVIGPGARLAEHVFVNRGVTVGHDTMVGAFSRLQPGSNLGGLSTLGRGVTVAIGATVLERLRIGDGAFIGAGSVVNADVAADTLAVGVPARFKKLAAS
ncbi:acetyltransferase [Rugamonas sp. CCM 8940]|uniref:acetyltransferase n=1 Tax=Rugamonas sp. CCM 8940 TaxID=2765359 RepID=UPI0018F5F74D|nr:acetyltransferase [Rugamonas sp. CCM 8940]MBJ7312761.1 acetyltransferase [Rugamonas sp. CCM 8940]